MRLPRLTLETLKRVVCSRSLYRFPKDGYTVNNRVSLFLSGDAMIVGRFLGSQLRLVILGSPGLQGRSDGRIADEVSEASVLVMPGPKPKPYTFHANPQTLNPELTCTSKPQAHSAGLVRCFNVSFQLTCYTCAWPLSLWLGWYIFGIVQI